MKAENSPLQFLLTRKCDMTNYWESDTSCSYSEFLTFKAVLKLPLQEKMLKGSSSIVRGGEKEKRGDTELRVKRLLVIQCKLQPGQ